MRRSLKELFALFRIQNTEEEEIKRDLLALARKWQWVSFLDDLLPAVKEEMLDRMTHCVLQAMETAKETNEQQIKLLTENAEGEKQ